MQIWLVILIVIVFLAVVAGVVALVTRAWLKQSDQGRTDG